jgi:hypothetical protein
VFAGATAGTATAGALTSDDARESFGGARECGGGAQGSGGGRLGSGVWVTTGVPESAGAWERAGVPGEGGVLVNAADRECAGV